MSSPFRLLQSLEKNFFFLTQGRATELEEGKLFFKDEFKYIYTYIGKSPSNEMENPSQPPDTLISTQQETIAHLKITFSQLA